MKKPVLFVVILIASLAAVRTGYAQLAVSPVINADSLVQILLGTGNTIVVSNATTDCPFSGQAATGQFTSTGTNIGMNSGILLTSGSIFNAVGPNSSGSITQSNGDTDGDALLNTLTTNTTQDACILEFDMLIPGDTVSFNYVFASDEYNDFVGTGFNDVFGFFISGPNPNGGVYTDYNIAQVPGTSTSITINNVNCGSNGQYYVCNDPWDPNGGGCSTQCPTSASSTTIEYDGFTTSLKAIAPVVPCNTYHLKIAVADVGDEAYDSGVFLEAGSLQSNAVNIQLASLYNDPAGNPAAVEGCSFNPQFNIRLNHYTLIGDSSVNTGAQDTACFAIHISGTATEGVDYDSIPAEVCFYPGDTLLTININVIDDNIPEGIETLVITLVPEDTTINACGTVGDSSVIFIYDFPVVVAHTDTTVCSGQPVHLYTNSAPNLTWSPGNGLACPTCMSNIIHPTSDVSYIALAQIGSCSAADTVVIHVIPAPVANAGVDYNICSGDSVVLNNSGSGGLTCHWTGNFGDVSDSCAYQVGPTGTTPYILTVTGANGCVDKDTVNVNVGYPPGGVDAGVDATVCANTPTTLNGYSWSFGVTYSWAPAASLNDPNIQYPVATPSSTTTYTLTVSDAGCSATDTVVINVLTMTAFAGNDTTICLGTQAHLHASINGDSYSWNPSGLLDNPGVYNPVATTTATTTFTVVITDINGCSASDDVVVTVNPLPNAGAGNDTAICRNASATLSAFGGSNYFWTPGEGLDNASSATPVATPSVTTTYNVVVSDNIGCSALDQVVVTVYQLPSVTATDDAAICSYETTPIGATSPDNVTYSWSPADGLNVSDQPYVVADPNASTIYTVTVVDQHGCTASDDVAVTLNPNPPLNAPTSLIYHLYALEPLTISVDPTYSNYYWTPGTALSDGFTPATDSTFNTPNPTVTAAPTEDIQYVVVATNSYGCTAIDTVTVSVVDDAVIHVPNAFSPNGDGHNEEFRIRYEGTFTLDLFAVYDRWGKEIWSTGNEGYDDGWTRGWDGKIGNAPAEIGSYAYVIKGHDQSGKQHVLNGNVTLIR